MRHHEDSTESKVNLTPMLDVVFIMLIFFIVTATFVQEVGIDASHPPERSHPPNPFAENIVVRISHLNRLTIGNQAIDVRRLRANLERLHAERPEASVVIDAHPESNNDTLVFVMDTSRLVGIHAIHFADRS